MSHKESMEQYEQKLRALDVTTMSPEQYRANVSWYADRIAEMEVAIGKENAARIVAEILCPNLTTDGLEELTVAIKCLTEK